jgi:hypothetical protein
MSEGRDELLHEVAGLPDPVLPEARVLQIQQLARARLVAGARPQAQLALLARAPEIIAAALLSACIAGYLTWTAVTVVSLQASPQSVVFQRAGAGTAR